MCRLSLTKNYQQKPWTHPELNHGTGILESDDSLNSYMASYGEMHENKCRVALQNFPYTLINASTEIIDWGCGQGIGSISILEFLNNHELTPLLKRITLIDPSEKALKRAEDNVMHLTGRSVEINALNKFLPCSDFKDNVINYVACRYKYIIHVFSNILDVKEINIVKIAEMISKSEGTHFILVTGPLNSASYRIEQFCNIFDVSEYFSKVSSPMFDVTSTGHPYTCVTRGFVYTGGPLNYEKMRSIQADETPIYDDYNLKLHLQNHVLDKDFGRVAFRLWNVLNDNDLMYHDCKINEASVDFIILRKGYGLLLVNVFAKNILDYQFKENVSENDDSTKSHNNSKYNYNVLVSENNEEIQSPLSRIHACHTTINEAVPEMLLSTIKNNKNFGMVRKAVIFTYNTQQEVDEFFKDTDKRYTRLYGKEFVFNSSVSKPLYKDTYLLKKYDAFNDEMYRKIKHMLSPGWHTYREGILGVKLSAVQKDLVLSRNIEQKISGVAGCGKTQVLVNRAVNAQKRTGGNILILTFNITLANYLRFRMSQLREDFNWNKFLIMHYHHFFRLMASKHNLKVGYDSYYDTDFFKSVKDDINKFSAIFIDEVQDYETLWIKILKKYFLVEGGEFVVFGDPKQNVYHRQLDKQGNIRIGVIGGEWNTSMKKSRRYINPLLAELASNFQQKYFDVGLTDKLTTEPNKFTGIFNFNVISYYNMMGNCSADNVIDKCIDIIKNSGVDPENFVILSSCTHFLRILDYVYRTKENKPTQTSFISKEQYEKLMEYDGIHSIKDTADWKFSMDLDAMERSKKYHFTTGVKCLKLSTIHSFKGWESPNVILLLDQDTKVKKENDNNRDNKKGNATKEPTFEPDSPEVIYTAITRAREQLYIINMKCQKYHEFFNNI